jgi:prophage regulatory protein
MRLLVFKELKTIKGIPYSRQHIHRLIKDGRFPKPLKPNGGPCGVNAWDESTIDQYQEDCKDRTIGATPHDGLDLSLSGPGNRINTTGSSDRT